MPSSDFDLKALYEAIDAQRRSRGLTWNQAAREINRFAILGHPIASSTITGLKTKVVAEGDGVIQMLVWLGRTPESFIPGFPDSTAEQFRLEEVGRNQVLRWDSKAIHKALNDARNARGLAWKQVSSEIGILTPNTLTTMAKGGRVGFPGIMRIVRWLNQPAATFIRPRPLFWRHR
jgi:hypothetical protein